MQLGADKMLFDQLSPIRRAGKPIRWQQITCKIPKTYGELCIGLFTQINGKRMKTGIRELSTFRERITHSESVQMVTTPATTFVL